VAFFADAVRTQSELALVKADQLIEYRERLLEQLHARSVRGVALRIAEDLVGAPVVTPTRAADKFGVSFQTANAAIGRLVEEGVLREVTGRSYARLFTSPHVIDLISA
jgi:Fic family protein